MIASVVIRRVRDLVRVIRLRSFDTSTEEGRSAERHRRIVLTVMALAAARATSILTALISVPLTLHYLGVERYGMWMTMSAFTATLAFADLGIGNGVLTAVARASGREELHLIRHYVSSAFALLGMVAVVILALFAGVYGYVRWESVFNVTTPVAQAEAAPAIAVFVVCFALSLPLGIVQRVQMGMQMGFMAGLWQCVASIAGLAGVLVAVMLQAGLPWLVAAFVGVPVLVSALNSAVFFLRVRPDFAPRMLGVSGSHAAELAQIGLLYFVLQLAVAITYTSDNLVIAQVLGAEQVAHYSVPDRLFAVVSSIVGLAVAPLWPAFGESLARGDHAWARRTLIRGTLLAGGVASGICLVFLVSAPALIHLWVGGLIEAPFMLTLGFAIWRVIEASVGAASMYLNAARIIRLQVITATITALIAIALKIVLVGRVGIAIVPWVTIVTHLICTSLPTFLALRRMTAPGTATIPATPT